MLQWSLLLLNLFPYIPLIHWPDARNNKYHSTEKWIIHIPYQSLAMFFKSKAVSELNQAHDRDMGGKLQ
jgi:hypothetical protein